METFNLVMLFICLLITKSCRIYFLVFNFPSTFSKYVDSYCILHFFQILSLTVPESYSLDFILGWLKKDEHLLDSQIYRDFLFNTGIELDK